MEEMQMGEAERENRQLKQILVDANAVACWRGDQYGLCDSILPSGEAYPGYALVAVLDAAAAVGFRPCVTFPKSRSISIEHDPYGPWDESTS